MSETTTSRKPYVKIIEEPCSRGMRFRYDSEGRSGSILGVNSTHAQKTYPTIQILNHRGPAFVVVSCVTKDEPYRPHPHNIAGKASEISQGICYFKVPAGQSKISFQNIGIQCVKKKDIIKSLNERERLTVDPFKTGYDHKKLLDKIDLTCIRLCFQVFLEGQTQGVFNIPLDPIVSAPIYDKKAAAELGIRWRSHYSAPVNGDTVVCLLLCEKVSKGDIQVRFFSEDTRWEAIAEITKYHKQLAVVFKTPKYIVQDIKQPVQVFVQLQRPSDGEVSTLVPFEFIPEEYASEDAFKAKRQKCRESPSDLVLRHLQEEADQNANPINVSTNAFALAKTELQGLRATTMYNPNIVKEPTHFSPYHQMNLYSEKPSTSNAMVSEFNHAYYNAQPMMQRFNQMTQNSMMNNGSIQQMMNSKNINLNYDQQYPGNANEQRNQQNSSYLDELLTSMMDQN